MNSKGLFNRIDFKVVNEVALRSLPVLLARWLPDGRMEGHEFVARSPRRNDRNHGSFKVSLVSGKWCDFATGDAGGDLVSLVSYLAGLSQAEAARRLATMLGITHG